MTTFLAGAADDPLVGPWLLATMAKTAATGVHGFDQKFGLNALTGTHGSKQGWGCDNWIAGQPCAIHSVGYTSRYFVAILQTSDRYPDPDRALATRTARLIAKSRLPPKPPPTCGKLTDVLASSPRCDNITWALNAKLMRAATGAFHPAKTVTRAAMAEFLFRLKQPPGQSPPPCETAPFPDVAASMPSCPAIAWAADARIAHGYADGTYRPDAPVTRGAMAAYVARVVRAGVPECPAAPFTDVGRHDAFCGVISWAAQAGVTRGYDDGTYRPVAPVSRQAMASFLHRAAPAVPHDFLRA